MATLLDVLVGLFGADKVRGYAPAMPAREEPKPEVAAALPKVDMPIPETRGADDMGMGGAGMPMSAGSSGDNIVGGTNYGLGGALLGALMGVPGLGTAGGVGLVGNATNKRAFRGLFGFFAIGWKRLDDHVSDGLRLPDLENQICAPLLPN